MLGWLTGGLVKEFTGPLERAYAAKLNAESEPARLEHERQIKFFEGQITLAAAAAEHDKWWAPRSLMGWIAVAYVAKLVLWDTVLGWGVTPDPGPQVTGIVMMVIGFYFGSKAATDVAARLFSAIRR